MMMMMTKVQGPMSKDGLTLGEEFMIFKRSDNDDDDDQGPRTNVQGRAYTRCGIYD